MGNGYIRRLPALTVVSDKANTRIRYGYDEVPLKALTIFLYRIIKIWSRGAYNFS